LRFSSFLRFALFAISLDFCIAASLVRSDKIGSIEVENIDPHKSSASDCTLQNKKETREEMEGTRNIQGDFHPASDVMQFFLQDVDCRIISN
jgi:hypothetical protein